MSQQENTPFEKHTKMFAEKENPYSPDCPNRHLYNEGYVSGFTQATKIKEILTDLSILPSPHLETEAEKFNEWLFKMYPVLIDRELDRENEKFRTGARTAIAFMQSQGNRVLSDHKRKENEQIVNVEFTRYKGKGEHSVNELEKIIEQREEELHQIKSLPDSKDAVERIKDLTDALIENEIYECECCGKFFNGANSAKVTQFNCMERNACISCQENSKQQD